MSAPKRPIRGTKRAPRRAPGVSADLSDVRRRIDALDDRLVELLNRRAALAKQAGAAKADVGKPAYVPERERQVLDRVAARGRGPLPEESLRLIYREIMSASRALESPLAVAYLGPEATFTHEAAKQHFGSSARLVAKRSIADVFADVERGAAAYGVVPVENSIDGVVRSTLDLFVTSELTIEAEILLDVHQTLLSRSGDLHAITKVYSYPAAFAQCRQWLERTLPEVPLIDVASTARGAEMAAEDDSAAAVASELAAGLYHLQVAARHIEDTPGNATRFLVLGHDEPKPTGSDRTSLMFALHDRPGILHRALAPFAKAGVNLTRIESRPTRRRSWNYVFFIDLEGHRAAPKVTRAIDSLGESCEFLRVLGSYPQGRLGRVSPAKRPRASNRSR